MAATNDPSPPPVSVSNYTGPAAIPMRAAPYPPSPAEAENYYYGIRSKPKLVARSSTNVWVQPTGVELVPKELNLICHNHPVRKVWKTVVPAMIEFLDSNGVNWNCIDPVRIGYEEEYPVPGSYAPAILWIGVIPDTLSAEDGVEAVTGCKRILCNHHIYNVHVEIRETVVHRWGSICY